MRPFGATVGDDLPKSRRAGGLGLGTAGSSVVLAGVLHGLLGAGSRFQPPNRSQNTQPLVTLMTRWAVQDFDGSQDTGRGRECRGRARGLERVDDEGDRS